MCRIVQPSLVECGRLLTLSIVLCVLFSERGYGDTKKWDAGGTDNKWSTDENWDDGDTPPGSSSDVELESTFTVSVDVELDQSATINSFLVSGPTVYALSQVEQTAGDLTITSTVDDAVIGQGSGEDGQYTLTDGTFETTGGCLWVGAQGATGWFYQDGGEVIVAEGNRFVVGENGVGEYEMTAGTLDASYGQIGGGSTSDEGTFTQIGATTDVEFHQETTSPFGHGYLTVGKLNSFGTYEIQDGYLTIDAYLRLGSAAYSGAADFIQSGGDVDVDEEVIVSDKGSIDMSGGTFSLASGTLEIAVPSSGSRITVDDGTFDLGTSDLALDIEEYESATMGEYDLTPYDVLTIIDGDEGVTLSSGIFSEIDVLNNTGITFTRNADGKDYSMAVTYGEASGSGQYVDATVAIPGDFNLDGVVDSDDEDILDANWLDTGQEWATGDANGDGTVNTADLNILGSNWGRSYP